MEISCTISKMAIFPFLLDNPKNTFFDRKKELELLIFCDLWASPCKRSIFGPFQIALPKQFTAKQLKLLAQLEEKPHISGHADLTPSRWWFFPFCLAKTTPFERPKTPVLTFISCCFVGESPFSGTKRFYVCLAHIKNLLTLGRGPDPSHIRMGKAL